MDGLVALMEGEHVGPFNLGNPGEFTMLELAEVCLFLKLFILFYLYIFLPLVCPRLGIANSFIPLLKTAKLNHLFLSRLDCQRNNWFECNNRIQTKYSWWSSYEKTRYNKSKGATELGTKGASERGIASHGEWFPESHSEWRWGERELIKMERKRICIVWRAYLYLLIYSFVVIH